MCENALILAQNLRRAAGGLYIKKEKSHPFSPTPLPISFPTSLLFPLSTGHLLSGGNLVFSSQFAQHL